ncbi:MAG TPA: saccharopine dehydrogenase NADP-binding domain-containing protein [Chloroflexia bacterium]
MGDRILVFGAGGYSGRMVVEELARRGQPMVLADRQAARMEALIAEFGLDPDVPRHVADVDHPETLPPMFEDGVRTVINCVGPFLRLGEPVVAAAVAAGVHYLDLSGEPPFIRQIIERYDAAARERGCVVVPTCGTEYALSNWAVALAARGLEPVDHIATTFGITRDRPSKGTQRSFFLALAQPTQGWRGGKQVPYPPARQMRRVRLPAPFGRRLALNSPLGELIQIPRHIQVTSMDSYLALPTPVALFLGALGPALPKVSPLIGRIIEPITRNPPPDFVEQSICVVKATARSGKGRRNVILMGRQVYRLAAAIVCWCALQTLEPGFTARGVLGPAQAFDPCAAVQALESAGLHHSPLPPGVC